MDSNRFALCLLDEIDNYVDRASPCVRDAKTATANDPSIHDVWFDPGTDRIVVRRTRADPFGERIAGLETIYVPGRDGVPRPHWCGLAFTKNASLRQYMQGVAGWNDKLYPPSPLAAMLATGILGAGLGYGGAALASGLLPGTWDKRKLRRGGLMFGGALGAAPGAIETAKSLLIGQPVTDGSHMRLPEIGKKSGNYLPHSPRYPTGPTIDADAMLHTVWKSPMVSGKLTPKERSLFTGAMLGSQQIARSNYVTPSDMARLTAGMGIGYASGLVAGKVLGTLTGLPTDARKTLADTGMYAGVVKAVLPMIYGTR